MDFFLSDPWRILYVWLGLAGLVLFTLMGADKSCARKGLRRVPERRLFLLAFLGGAAGGWLGMYVFRHKTRHLRFVLGFPLIAAVQLAFCIYLAAGQ